MENKELMGAILSLENLLRAYKRVVQNGGAAGVDRVETGELASYLREHWPRVRSEILEGRYRPSVVRGVEIPKASGGKRLLGIPTVLDRLIQQAVHQVLSPLWESDFSPYSYGFRPGRNAHQALRQAVEYINAGYQDVIDLDLKSFFDRVSHDKIMSLIRKKIKDRALLRLIRRYLQSGILLGGAVQQSSILLNELDRELTKRGHRFVRYADDCSIFLRSKRAAERVKASITRFLEGKLLLEVNQEKTKICRPVHFVLLGHAFTSTYKKGERGKYRLSIARKSWESLKRKIKVLTRKTHPVPLEERIRRLKRLMYGWVNYFKYATGYEKFEQLDGWVRNRLRYCIWKMWKKPWRRYRAFRQLGINHEWAMKFAWSRKGGWRLSCSPVMGMTVTEERLKQRGYLSFKEYYHQVRQKSVVS
jgi:group II intron reverse transcriptase/maturase